MKIKQVKDIMMPLADYPVVSEDDTLLDAILALDEAQKKKPEDHEPYRAVLVDNSEKKIVGKIGHLAFLKGLEPKYDKMGDLGTLSRVGLSSEFIINMMHNMELWKGTVWDYYEHAKHTLVKEIMHPITEHIKDDASIGEAVHKVVMYQTLSLLVTHGDSIVGILRLSILFKEVAKMLEEASLKHKKGK